MKINKKSWHWWLHRKLDTKIYKRLSGRWNGTVSLCQYFWSTVFTLIQGIFISILLVIGLIGLIGILHLKYAGLTGIMIILASFIFLLEGFVAYSRGKISFWPNYISKYFVKDTKEQINKKEHGLFISYYKAWKEKFCPIVELEE